MTEEFLRDPTRPADCEHPHAPLETGTQTIAILAEPGVAGVVEVMRADPAVRPRRDQVAAPLAASLEFA